MQKIIGKLALTTIAVGWSMTGQATLIGDTVSIGHYFPDSSTVCADCLPPATVVVEAGVGDLVTLGVGNLLYTVDMEANGFIVSFPSNSGWVNNVSFNGLIISDLDWVGDSSGYISGLILNTVPDGYLTENITFTDDSVSIRLGVPGTDNNSFFPGERFDITFETVHVPLPGTLALLGLGLAGLGWTRRSRSNSVNELSDATPL